jgi:SAM-dependent methyltransferase
MKARLGVLGLLLLGAVAASGAEGTEPLSEFKGVAGSSAYGYTLANNVFVPSGAKNSGLELEDRFLHIDLEALVTALDLKPGVVVLDVGAGSGAFSLPMAKALGGSGQVFATEIDGPQVTYMNGAARDQKLSNFQAVKVGGGFDAFYGSQVFDRVFFGSVYQFLPDPVDYLGRLARSLRPDTGRLFLLHPILYPEFSPKRQLDPANFVAQFRGKDPQAPLARRLSGDLRARVFSADGEVRVDRQFHQAAVANLNAMLDDPALPVDLLDGWARAEGSFDAGALWWTVEDEYLDVSSFLHYLYGPQLRQPPATPESGLADAVRTLNYAALRPLFYPQGGAMGYAFGRGFFDSQRVLVEKLRRAGLQHVATHNVSHYYLLVEFKRAP